MLGPNSSSNGEAHIHTSKHTGQSGHEETVEINARAPFVSKKGHSLLSADFQQIELRLLAHLSNDERLIGLFNSDSCNDVFIALSSQWLTKKENNVTSADREQTKRIVYSVMYGVGKERLAEYLKTTPEDAKNIMNSFLVSFPSINTFSRRCVQEAQRQGYQKTLFGRRRRLPHIAHPAAPQLRAQSERQAVNFCVQGSAADVSKAAMVDVQAALSRHPRLHEAKLLVHIHDELLLEVPDVMVKETAELVKTVMETKPISWGVTLKVPLPISVSTGKSWATLEQYKF